MGRSLVKVEVGFTISKKEELEGRELRMGVYVASGPLRLYQDFRGWECMLPVVTQVISGLPWLQALPPL